MAKAAKTAIKTKDQKAAADAKNWTKVIRTLRSPKSGAYTFEAIVHNTQNYLSEPSILKINLQASRFIGRLCLF